MKSMQVNGTSADPLLRPAEVPRPIPGEGEVLIRVHAAGVTPTELLWYPTSHTSTGEPRIDAIPGHEFSGDRCPWNERSGFAGWAGNLWHERLVRRGSDGGVLYYPA